MPFYTQGFTCIYKLELHTCDAVTPLHSFVLVVSGGLLSDGISHHCRESLCTKPFLFVSKLFAYLAITVSRSIHSTFDPNRIKYRMNEVTEWNDLSYRNGNFFDSYCTYYETVM